MSNGESKSGSQRLPAFRMFVAASVVLVLAIALTPASAFANTVDTQSYLGTAYGTSASVGNTLLVSQTAPVTLGGTCGTSQQPLNVPGTGAGVSLLPLLSGGAVNTDVSSSLNSAQAVSDTGNINLLAGLISAQEIKAVSTTTIDSDGTFHMTSAGSTFSNLIILGHVYNGSVPANTRINIPLLGYVVLNEQITHLANAMANMTVNMIHVHVTGINLLGLQVGTDLVVSSATSGIVKVFAPAILNGQSYATQVIGPLLASGPSAPAILPCTGTNGSVITTTLGSLNLPGILNSGTVTDTAESNITQTLSSGQNTSTIQGLNLLNGLITANVMRAQVNVLVNNAFNNFMTGTDSFVGLSVAGHPEITDNVPNNTSVSLAGLGTLYLKRVVNGASLNQHSIEVRSLELVVNQNNTLGLPIGLDVIVGDAQIQIVPDSNP